MTDAESIKLLLDTVMSAVGVLILIVKFLDKFFDYKFDQRMSQMKSDMTKKNRCSYRKGKQR